ncbi:hypothetical protein [Shewanella colwelliana]|uniref:hypothetical protein n=1 Tax=Shewanella colwelliana TaxID=23 RepID=UPI0022AE76DE|nr:hypothetical protein [Shewanella colwelliana]MCZ4337810.1 hypothetical protein [Shewanella colwelliana]
MLTKQKFNAATSRLQDILTTSDLLQMLRYRLAKESTGGQYADVISCLTALPNDFCDKPLLDRRRAENYLANALYGRHHSQIAHLMRGDHLVKDDEFGKRAEIYGKCINHFATFVGGEDEVVEAHGRMLAKRLRAISPEDFHVSYQGYNIDVDRFGDLRQYNALCYVSFLDIEVHIELVLIRNESPETVEPILETTVLVEVKGMRLEEYGKMIGCQLLDEKDDYASIWDLEVLFSNVAYELAYEGRIIDFYCAALPRKLLQEHQWKLNLSRSFIAGRQIKGGVLHPINAAIEAHHERYSKEVLESVRGLIMYNRSFHDYDDVELTLKGFPDEISRLISGELIFTHKSGTAISVFFSYANVNGTPIIFQLNVRHNGEEIESFTDTVELGSAGRFWGEVVDCLPKVLPYVKVLPSSR